MRRLAYVVSLVLFVFITPASYAKTTEKIIELVQQVQEAARQLDYSGVLNYTNETGTESMSLVHVVDGKGERERLSALDGIEREYLRNNDVIQCLIPEQKLVIIEKPRDGRFPALLTGQAHELARYYRLQKEGIKRVAGRNCDQYTFVPTDDWRYGYTLCVDAQEHLLLKLQTVDYGSDGTPHVVNQVAFANVNIGKSAEANALDSAWQYNDWKVIAAQMKPTNLAAQGWRIPYPDGFVPVNEISRFMRTDREVTQLVLSDGLASISIFIEPNDELGQRLEANEGTKNGSTHLYRKRIGEYWLTATGEIPLKTLHYLGNNTEFVPIIN